MFCPECGTKNMNDAVFCQNCGVNFEKTRKSVANQPARGPQYEAPVSEQRAHSPILNDVEEASVADHRDNVSAVYYFLSLFLWPLGIILWALHRQKKPESAKNLLAASIAGLLFMILVLLL